MEITDIIAAVQAGISLAPQVASLVESGKKYIAALFEAGLISKDTQDSLHKWVDETVSAHLEGRTPPHWQVRPDPTEVA